MKQITGSFVRPDGSPAANATLELWLSQDATNPSLGHVTHCLITVQLDADGKIPSGTHVFGNDELLPASTVYRAVVLDQSVGGEVFNEKLSIVGADPIDLNLIAPALK